MTRTQLAARLSNWGLWLCWEADIAPEGARCTSLESRHLPEAGTVWDDPEPPRPAPNVPDAEAMQSLIRNLDRLHQYALAVEYGGTPCVMRWRRMGEYVHSHSLALAEIELCEMMRKRA